MHERWTPIFQHQGFAGRARASQGRPEGLGQLSVLARGPCSCLLQQGCLWSGAGEFGNVYIALPSK